MIDDMLAEGGSPVLMESLGDPGALQYTSPDESQTATYDAILGRIRAIEEPQSFGNVAGMTALDEVERQTVQVVPKVSMREIVDSGKVKVKQPGCDVLEAWSIDSITSRTPSMVTMELKRPREKRGAEIR